jgi:hypothetical protein
MKRTARTHARISLERIEKLADWFMGQMDVNSPPFAKFLLAKLFDQFGSIFWARQKQPCWRDIVRLELALASGPLGTALKFSAN